MNTVTIHNIIVVAVSSKMLTARKIIDLRAKEGIFLSIADRFVSLHKLMESYHL